MKQLQSRFCRTAIAAAVILAALFCRNACADLAAPSGELVTLHLEVDKERVFAGESVQVTVSLAADGIKVRNVAYPRLPAVNGRQLSFTQLSGQAEINDNSARYRFSAAFTPLTPGELRIGPAELSMELLQPAGGAAAFFGGVEPQPVTVTSSTVSIKVTPLPGSDRPTSFAGAVGIFKLILEPLPATISAGTPLTIKSRIAGDGNLTRADCPALRAAGSRSYPPRRLQQTGALLCEQVVMPETAGPLPALEWSYFDPQQQRYVTLSATLPVAAPLANRSTVTAPRLVQPVPTVPESSTAAPGRVIPSLVAATLLLIAGTVLVLMRRSKRPPAALPAKTNAADLAQWVKDLEAADAGGNVEEFYALTFGILQQIVAVFSGSSADGVCGVPAEGGFPGHQEIDYLFSRCHSVRYGRLAPSRCAMADDLRQLHTILALTKRAPL